MLLEKFLNEEPRFTIKDNIIIGSGPNQKETRNVAQVILDSLIKYPDFVAQIDTVSERTTTFSEIKDRIIRCALWLRKQGVCEDDIIGIMTHNQQDDFIPYLSIMFVNAIYNPWFHKITEIMARRYFQICRPKIMFASEQTIDMLAKVASETGINCQFIVYGSHSKFPSLNSLMAQQTEEEVKNFEYVLPKTLGKKVGMIFFSSGTTGDLKATMLPYDSLLQHVPEHSLKTERSDYWLWYSPLAWNFGTVNVTYMIQWRFTRILHAEFEPIDTSQVIEKYKVNVIAGSPTMLIQLYKSGVLTNFNYTSVNMMITTGSAISTIVLEEYRKLLPHSFIVNGFGMTEAGQYVTRKTKCCKKMDSIGFVCEDVSVKVVDESTGNELGPNQQGEICFKIDTAMLGYMKDKETTKKVIDKDGWIHTGDLGHYDVHGEISIIDRIKNIINFQTNKISPASIESIMLKHPAVAKCVVVPVTHSVDIERPFAFVVKAPGAEVTEEELIEFPGIHNIFYKLVGGLTFVDGLIYTESGKINIQHMKDKANALCMLDKIMKRGKVEEKFVTLV